ncbi:uncharacterized protein PV09_03168 [Verruconis gallopava]|uniref:Autophagy-related protein 27 n=1 Tax=Verruconis gallopava TaxID=253628 RepID=A0A0D2B452_9PEZI|nr:uncharacterized protein PV09_03168 [Verruconis gallopava]KIW05984.1 hypothetical protein PV09_03168 [Verruconis gallopava]
METRISTILSAIYFFLLSLNGALAAAETGWKYGDSIPVTCLNRTIDTGEHVTDSLGNLQYIPFYTCAETSRPLSLRYGVSATQNCTIALTDPIYHLFEFYIHNDAPLTCRVPTNPSAGTGIPRAHISGKARQGGLGQEEEGYTPLVMALSGQLQLSHLHLANELNLVVHTALPAENKKSSLGSIDSASAYSVSPGTKNTKLIIGDAVTLTFHTRWYSGSYLPMTNSIQKHGFWSTLSYCIFAAGASAAICIAYFRGVDLPRRLRWHGIEKLGARRENGLPKYNGYGYTGPTNGTVNGYGGYGLPMGTGKRD